MILVIVDQPVNSGNVLLAQTSWEGWEMRVDGIVLVEEFVITLRACVRVSLASMAPDASFTETFCEVLGLTAKRSKWSIELS